MKLKKLTNKQESLIPVVRDKAIYRALFDKPSLDVERAHVAMNSRTSFTSRSRSSSSTLRN
jgi:hypothetical protein